MPNCSCKSCAADPSATFCETVREWKHGQKVRCIDDSFTPEQIAASEFLPEAGCIYTIRSIRIVRRHPEGYDDVAFLLEEIVNTRLIYGKEPGFWHTRFEAC